MKYLKIVCFVTESFILRSRDNKLYCFVFIMLCFCSSCFALTFNEVDFEELILEHPIMKDYDNKTGHFKNTAYAIYEVEDLKKEVEELNVKLDSLKNKETLQTSDFDEEKEEDYFWNSVKANSEGIKELEEKIWEKNNLIYSNGDTGYDKLFDITSKMCKDIILPLYSKNRIIINKLPKYYFLSDNKTKRLNTLFNFKNSQKLKEYIEKASIFSSVFPNSNKTIIYNSKDLNVDKIGIIDLYAALMLHPKMALFNFMNFGFYKYEFGLTTDELLQKEEEYKKVSIKNDEINKLKKELEELHAQKVTYYNDLNNSIMSEEISSFFTLFPEKEKILQKRLFDAEYTEVNVGLTTPEESIKIIDDIYKDLNLAIHEVLKEKQILLLLNASLPINYGYKIDYPLNGIKGLGYAGVNYVLFYAFFNKNYLNGPFRDYGNDYFCRRRFKLICACSDFKKQILPFKPYPMILTGGNSILADVIKKIYGKYNINSSAYAVLDSVISKIEAYQNGKDY